MHMLSAIIATLALTTSLSHDDAVVKAFEQYEAIRVALSADQLKDVAPPATALAPLAEQIGGAAAKKAAGAVAAAKKLSEAREQFAVLSNLLVPAFEKAGIKNVHFFVCPMEGGGPWAQRGKDLKNPYMGKSMPTCGTPKK